MSQEQQRNRITIKNERALRKRKKLKLKKIKTLGLRATGLIIGLAGTAFIADAILPPTTLTNPTEINLEYDEEYLREDLKDYYNAREDYKEGKISTQEFVAEARELSDAALGFMKDEIKNSTNAVENDRVYIERSSGTADGPIDTIKIESENGDIKQVYDELPSEIAETFNEVVKMENWNGSGKNWTEKEGKKFMHEADELYESLSSLGEIEENLELEEPIIDNSGNKTR